MKWINFLNLDESSDRLFTITDKISNISKTKLELIVDTYGQHLIGTPEVQIEYK